MSEGMKVAIVGEAGLLFGFRALGLKVFSPARPSMRRGTSWPVLEKEDYGLCFLHESYFGPLKEEREAHRKEVLSRRSWAFRITGRFRTTSRSG